VNELTANSEYSQLGNAFTPIRTDEETLVADSRASLSPSQQVEQRLIGMLKTSPLMVSQVQRRLKPGPR
jgi:hypothetical protein